MMEKEKFVLEYLQARSIHPEKEEWQRMKVFMREYEKARGDVSHEVLAEQVLSMLKGERSFLNHISRERSRFSENR